MFWEGAAFIIGTASGVDSTTFLQLAALVFGGGAAAAYISGRTRKRSGEAGADASEANAVAATEMAGAVKDVVQPLREENARAHGRIAELQTRLSEKTELLAEIKVAYATLDANFEKYRHSTQSDITAAESQRYALELQIIKRDEVISDLQEQLVAIGDRRSEARRATDEPPPTDV